VGLCERNRARSTSQIIASGMTDLPRGRGNWAASRHLLAGDKKLGRSIINQRKKIEE